MIRFFFLLTVLWAGGFYVFLQSVPNDIGGESQAIVVLTGGKGRVEEGLRLLKEDPTQKLFISGVHEDVRLEEVTEDKSLQSRISLGYKAGTTIENAQETCDWLIREKITSIRLVTSFYHISRALLEFKRQMPSLKVIPHPVLKDKVKERLLAYDGQTLALLIQEYHKYLFALIYTGVFAGDHG